MRSPSIWILGIALNVVGPAAVQSQVAFEDVFSWVATLTLEDRPEALNAAPILHRDPAGGWIVADRAENQVRIYNAEGALQHYFGRQGSGPGEFRGLVGAVRASGDTIATVDSYGRIALWSGTGSLVREFRVELLRISSVAFVPPGTLVVASVPQIADPSNLSVPVLHFVDLEGGKLTGSTLAPRITPEAVAAWVTVSGASIAPDGARYLVTLPLADTIWEFRPPDQTPASRTRISHPLLNELLQIPNGHDDRGAFEAWLRRAYFVLGAVPAGPGAYFVRLSGFQKEPRLLWVTPESPHAVEVIGSPVLLAYDDSTGMYLFQDPRSLEPNRLRHAKLRPEGQPSAAASPAAVNNGLMLRGPAGRLPGGP